MKFLNAVALEAYDQARAEDPNHSSIEQLGMEGLTDSVMDGFKAVSKFTKKAFSSLTPAAAKATVDGTRKTLKYVKGEVSKAKLDKPVKADISKALGKFNIKANSASELIAQINKKRHELEELAGDTIADANKGKKPAVDVQKSKAYKEDEGKGQTELEFTKKDMLALIDAGIAYCDSYDKLQARVATLEKRKVATEAMDDQNAYKQAIADIVAIGLQFLMILAVVILIVLAVFNPVTALLGVGVGLLANYIKTGDVLGTPAAD